MVIRLRIKLVGGIALLLIFLTVGLFIFKSSTEVSATAEKKTIVTVPIIMYHEVKTFKTGKDVITPYEFESDLKYLSENHYTTITMTQLIDYVYNNTPLPEKPIILSFDDGYLSTYVYVYPLLKKYKMSIVFSIIGKNTDDFTNVPDSNLDYSHVTWKQLNEMLDSGYVEVQNHTYNLHSTKNGRLGCKQKAGESLAHYEQSLKDDVGKLQDELTELTGHTPNTFAYPYGYYSSNTDFVLMRLGFQASLSCDYGINVIAKDPKGLFGLKRICRAHGQSVQKVLTDAMKTLK